MSPGLEVISQAILIFILSFSETLSSFIELLFA